jgi:hypothetical protein
VIKDYEQANGVGIIGKLFGCMQEEHENNQNLDKMQLEKKTWKTGKLSGAPSHAGNTMKDRLIFSRCSSCEPSLS